MAARVVADHAKPMRQRRCLPRPQIASRADRVGQQKGRGVGRALYRVTDPRVVAVSRALHGRSITSKQESGISIQDSGLGQESAEQESGEILISYDHHGST